MTCYELGYEYRTGFDFVNCPDMSPSQDRGSARIVTAVVVGSGALLGLLDSEFH